MGRRHAAYFALCMLAIVLALASPIDAMSDQLLTMHMIQHMLLLMIAPPLLLLGKPIPVLVVGTPLPLARWLARSHARARRELNCRGPRLQGRHGRGDLEVAQIGACLEHCGRECVAEHVPGAVWWSRLTRGRSVRRHDHEEPVS